MLSKDMKVLPNEEGITQHNLFKLRNVKGTMSKSVVLKGALIEAT